jgi:hypothetical protein
MVGLNVEWDSWLFAGAVGCVHAVYTCVGCCAGMHLLLLLAVVCPDDSHAARMVETVGITSCCLEPCCTAELYVHLMVVLVCVQRLWWHGTPVMHVPCVACASVPAT